MKTILLVSSMLMSFSSMADVYEALECSEGFVQTRICEYVDGPHDTNYFNICMNRTDPKNLRVEINVATAYGDDVLAQDKGTFK
ncbi:MAG: hypothetical protein K2Q18_18255, partial [Bdellovibrionales bacterium]|nr:hypothetical protein [Bdellovibrionales bacterium]